MKKCEHIKLIIFLATGCMVLLLLYSPWGSPDLYHKRIYFVDNQGVNFNNKNIGRSCFQVNSLKSGVNSLRTGIGSLKRVKNAPHSGAVSDDATTEIQVEDNYTKRKNKKHYSANNYPASAKQSNGSARYGTNSNTDRERIASGSSVSISSSYGGGVTRNSGSSNGSVGSVSFGAQIARISSSPVARVSSLNTDLTLFNDSTAPMGANAAMKVYFDPGDDPIDPNPVPVPDGWGFLLFAAAIYVAIKRKSLLKKHLAN